MFDDPGWHAEKGFSFFDIGSRSFKDESTLGIGGGRTEEWPEVDYEDGASVRIYYYWFGEL